MRPESCRRQEQSGRAAAPEAGTGRRRRRRLLLSLARFGRPSGRASRVLSLELQFGALPTRLLSCPNEICSLSSSGRERASGRIRRARHRPSTSSCARPLERPADWSIEKGAAAFLLPFSFSLFILSSARLSLALGPESTELQRSATGKQVAATCLQTLRPAGPLEECDGAAAADQLAGKFGRPLIWSILPPS